MRETINSRLWYALGDIEPTEDKMTRAVTSMLDLFQSERTALLEDIKKDLKVSASTIQEDDLLGSEYECLKLEDAISIINKYLTTQQ